MKYKAGDKVRVRKDLVVGKRDGCYPAVGKMVEKSGKIATIRTVHSDFYEIYKDVYSWTDEMFEPVVLFRIMLGFLYFYELLYIFLTI